ncbi:hypothetical protein Pmar_PMAR011487 [Perkinsus marinus ATCC 50983]|uniref:GPI inositol-deacylase n=1 Tax=Perkinsus marinus (strain ATCC 50983 / TXsc) TaxID=423536 RepID=C5LBY2_PERM5|nr:hypothetical protein Pmar_PMAR011487 [Perkinsus marinus ATCC 50983]EER05465.1 hypothetical protein Pmar_PMAR011487 [Perkinsus marinus ATCC 50983]|eukprot:XP_002773649.1 hypothetical protein Pmar_PMAR011487 [Perkinsus marinus ATCC 50983]
MEIEELMGVLDKTLILALDFYEEPNAFHPSVVEAQAEFTRGLMAGVCTEGKKCVLVGHSMGGVVAAIAVSKSSEDIVKNVVSLVTVSTPLKTHPAMLDFGWSRVYREVGVGLDKVAVVSVTGGAADWQVPMEDTMVDGKARLQWAQMPTSDGVFAQGDHIAVMYSYEVLTYQVVPAIARALGWRTGAVVGDNDDLKAWMMSLDRPVRRHVPYDRKIEVDGSRVVEVKPLGLGKIRQVWNKGLIIDVERKSGAMLILRREGSYSRCPSVEVVDFNDKEYFSVEAPEVCDYCMRAGNNSAVVTVGAREMPLTSVHIRGDTWCVSPPISSDMKTILVPPGRGGFVVALSSPTVMKLKSRSAYEQYEMGVQLSGIGDAPYLACLVGGDHEVLSATSSSSGGRALMAPSRPLRARRARVMRGAVDTLVVVSTADDVGLVGSPGIHTFHRGHPHYGVPYTLLQYAVGDCDTVFDVNSLAHVGGYFCAGGAYRGVCSPWG